MEERSASNQVEKRDTAAKAREGGGAGTDMDRQSAVGQESAEDRRGAEDRGPAAFMEMVRRHDPGLRMLAYRLLQDRTEMDDAMQDAYLKAFRGLPRFRGEAQARTWLYRIVYNTCLGLLRSRRRRREVSLGALADSAEGRSGDLCGEGCAAAYVGRRVPAASRGADDPAEWVARHTDLSDALASLPEDQRAAVLLVDAAGFTYEEAAEVLGVRPGTIGSRLNHARSALRATLSGEGGR